VFANLLNFVLSADSVTLGDATPTGIILALKAHAISQSYGTMDTTGIAYYVSHYLGKSIEEQVKQLGDDNLISNDLKDHLVSFFSILGGINEEATVGDVTDILDTEDSNIAGSSLSAGDKGLASAAVLYLRKGMDIFGTTSKPCGIFCWVVSVVVGVVGAIGGYVLGGGGPGGILGGIGGGVLGFALTKCCIFHSCGDDWDCNWGLQ
jgi:hypothetical protein